MTKDSKKSNCGSKDSHKTGNSVGYKKPPKASQFKKGHSGNPRGRPRKSKADPILLSDRPYDSFLREEIYRKVKLRENGKEIEIPAQQAVMRARVAGAIKGNRFSQNWVLEESAKKEQEYSEAKKEYYLFLAKQKSEGEKKLAEAKRNKTKPPNLIPHPDDIILNPETGNAYVAGPETEADVEFYKHSGRLRDHLLLRAVHDDCEGERPKGYKETWEGEPHYDFFILAHFIDGMLPRKFRWQKVKRGKRTTRKLNKRRQQHYKMPPDLSLALKFSAMSQKEREMRIADEFADLVATNPSCTIDVDSPEARKLKRALERISIKPPGT